MPTGERREVHAAYSFKVIIGKDKANAAFFRSVGGLKSETEAIPMPQGGQNEYEPKLVGLTKYPNLVFKRGLASGDWFKLRQNWVFGKPPQRFTVTITQLGPGNKEVFSWSFQRAWVCKWEGPEFDATKSEISVETLEIAHEGPLPGSGGGGGGGDSGGGAGASKKGKSKSGGSTSPSKARASASGKK